MARTIGQIKAAIKEEVRNHPELDVFLFPEDGGSKVSVFNLIIAIVAIAIFAYESIHDAFRAEIQLLANRAISGNTAWLQDQILKFQSGDLVTIDEDFVPVYDPVDESAKIITRCAVVDGDPVTIKVAKGEVGALEPLSAGELTALQNYYYGTSTAEGIGFAGIAAQFVSLYPDRMYVEANVYFQGSFTEEDTKAAVIAAIDNYFNTLQDENFNGVIYMETLRDVIQSVAGVTRIELVEIKTRAQSVAFGSAVTQDIQGVYQTIAGYLISEDTASNTLNDTITMVKETV